MENFRAKLSEFGLFPEHIEITDKIKRFPVDGKNKNGWYFFNQIGVDSYGAYGNWATDLSETYTSFENGKSEKEIQKIKEEFEKIKKESDQLRKKEAEEVSIKASEMWKNLKEGGHPYLTKKKIKAHGTRRYKTSLVIPIFKDGKIVSLQFIDSSGKRFMSGGEVSGGAYVIKGTKKYVVVCEGFSTGASVFESTGYQVFISFNAGNLSKVAKRVKEIMPESKIIIACDNDRHKEINIGVEKGTQAAELVGGILSIPEFKEDNEQHTDFNDLFIAEGMAEVKRQLTPEKSDLEKSLKEWCLKFQGGFTIQEILNHFGIKDKQGKNEVDSILSDLCAENIIQQDNKRRSAFRVVDTNISIIDIKKQINTEGVDIRLPFGLSEFVLLEDRTVVVIAGDSNSGKTAVMLEGLAENIMFSNRFKKPVYISTEMSQAELKRRLNIIQSEDVWENAEFLDYTGHFQDAIKTGRSDNLVYIDQLEVNDSISYADMEKEISAIRHSLTTGISIIAMQKTAGSKMARGGAGTLTKPRLYISLHHCYKSAEGGVVNRAEVVKCKMTKPGYSNPEGRQLIYHITKEGVIEYVTEWEFINEIDSFLGLLKRKIPEKIGSTYDIKYQGKYKE